MVRLLHVLGVLCFVAFAAVQLNDPDPVRWVAIYLAAAASHGLASAGRGSRPFAASVGLVALGWGAWITATLPAGEWDLGFDSELLREIGGVVVTAAGMALVVAAPGRPGSDATPR
jgi:hypothetical protein